jgi:hypothetical protein
MHSLHQMESTRMRAIRPTRSRRTLSCFINSFCCLTLEGEAGTELVAGLVELLGIERATNAEGQARVDLGVVGKGCNAEVVNLGLDNSSVLNSSNCVQYSAYLGERERVELVLGRELKTDVGAGL